MHNMQIALVNRRTECSKEEHPVCNKNYHLMRSYVNTDLVKQQSKIFLDSDQF